MPHVNFSLPLKPGWHHDCSVEDARPTGDFGGANKDIHIMLILLVLLVLLLAAGGGYYGNARWGYGGGAGVGLGTILVILLVAYMLGFI
ncbi:hypothetical protein F183_A53570 [Bryobacterales bacterium F-183]|nr:hypothetical protein F183_A53570 [Bryobacterales bacterium F-183]